MDESSARAFTLARALGEAVGQAPPSPPAPVSELSAVFEALITEPELVATTRQLFVNGHYAQAVEEGYKLLNNTVKAKAGHPVDGKGSELDGSSLMTHVFGLASPILRFNDLKSESKKNRQLGYMLVLQGSMIGVRNPRAHEHGHPDDPRNALELLTLCSHLLRTVKETTRTRRRRKGP